MKILQYLSFFLFSLMAFSTLCGEGFRNPAPGAWGLGQSGGRTAFVSDPTAASHNPANLVEVDEPAVLLTPTFLHFRSEFKVDGGPNAKSKDPWKILPNLYAVGPAWSEDVSWGLAVTVPYGLSNEWETTGAFGSGGPFRYQIPYFSELRTIQINPNIAWRPHPDLSLSAGVNALWSELRIKQFFPPLAVGGTPLVSGETVARAKTDGWGYGVNLAATWDPTPRDRLAVTWRSPISVSHTGSGQIGNLTPAAMAMGFQSNGPANTTIRYPQILGIGYGRMLTNRLFAEAQVEWIQFSRFESLDLDLGSNTPLFGGANVIPQDWDDTFTAGGSLRYLLTDQSQLHGSYHYFESPVPDATLSTVIPDSNQHAFTGGITTMVSGWDIGLGYSYVIYEDRRTPIAGVPGRLESRLHIISVQLGYRF